jgi:hypothetical protein
MKKIIVLFFAAALLGCNNERDSDTKGNTDTTIDSIAVEKDNTINRDKNIRIDSGMKDTSR